MEKEKVVFKEILKILGVFLLYFFLTDILNSFHITRLKLYMDNQEYFKASVIYLINQLIVTGIIILINLPDLKRDFKKFKDNYKAYLKMALKVWGIGLLVMFVSNTIINILVTGGEIATNESNNRDILKQLPLYAIPAMMLTGPIVEELVFRNNFRKLIKNKTKFAIITGFIFGSAHVLLSLSSFKELLFLIPYCGLGIALSYIVAKTDNIYPSICMHILHNTFTLLIIIMSW